MVKQLLHLFVLVVKIESGVVPVNVLPHPRTVLPLHHKMYPATVFPVLPATVVPLVPQPPHAAMLPAPAVNDFLAPVPPAGHLLLPTSNPTLVDATLSLPDVIPTVPDGTPAPLCQQLFFLLSHHHLLQCYLLQ